LALFKCGLFTVLRQAQDERIGPAHDEPSPVRGEIVEPPNPGTSGFWDGFLEKGDYRVDVEIAVASRLSREIAHIKNCLAVGYDRMFDVFADEKMQQKTQEALEGGFSGAEREKIQLLHLSKLSDLIYSIASVVDRVGIACLRQFP
jgi:hypothetical protein